LDKQKELRIETPPKDAVGMKAIKSTFKQMSGRISKRKALSLLSKVNQKDGIDCPGCAWPDPVHRSKLGEYCENGAKAIIEEAMDVRFANPEFFKKHSISDLKAQSDYWLGHRGRLTHPMVLRPGATHYEEIKWDDAFQIIGTELKGLSSPNEAMFYTSGRTSNEAAFLYQLFVRMYGTNNLPDCSNMCHESSGAALNKTVGIGKGSVTLDDLYKAELIFVFGQNPATNHPRMLTALEKAKQNGAKIISVNPMKEVGLVHFKNPQTFKGLVAGGTKMSDIFFQVRINEDVALIKAILIKLLKKAETNPEVIDSEFIKNKTADYEALIEDLKKYNVDELVERTGLDESEINTAVEWVASSSKIITCWGMGLTQHENGVDNIQELVNLLLLKGSIGKEGAGTCPVRGHSNVQGDRTMGIAERPSKALLDKIAENFGFQPPTEHGLSVIECITAMHEEKGKVFIAMGGNFLSAAPDTHFTAEALAKTNLTVQISTKLNRSHLEHGKTALILPSMGRTDKFVRGDKEEFLTVENSMGVISTTKGALTPPSDQVMSEPMIVAGMAKASVDQDKVDWDFLTDDYSRIRDLIEKTIAGFENYNERVKKPLGFELPNGSRTGDFTTPNKKANFTVNAISNINLDKEEFVMMTTRSHDQFNTTIYGLDDRYRGVFNSRMVVFMNREEMTELGYSAGDKITLYNDYGQRRSVEGFAIVPYEIPRRCLATYYPEANPLVPLDVFAHTSLTPSSKSIKVKIM
jgi:molybdopterin-dependent oxidoreductase alpha subunit